MTTLKMIFMSAAHDRILRLVVLTIICDTVFGILRAFKEHKFNSGVGINGAIRKVGMLLSLLFLAVFDTLIQINLIGLIPENVRLAIGVEFVGTMRFFGLLYIAYEMVSILKHMSLCGLPVKKVWITVYDFLHKYTDELPDTLEEDLIEMEDKKK